jgi:RNA polymerase sigma-70 factor, ECF subfamily
METSSAPVAAPYSLAALRRGEGDAMAAVYRDHAPALLRSIGAIMGDRSEAEDVVHDLFVGLPEAMGRYEERGAFGGWLRRIGMRMALSRLRTRARRQEVSLSGADDAPHPAADEALARHLLVERALAALPDGMRVVVVLRELEGWPYRDIAEHLGLKEGAVMTRHCRAMQKLREALEAHR